MTEALVTLWEDNAGALAVTLDVRGEGGQDEWTVLAWDASGWCDRPHDPRFGEVARSILRGEGWIWAGATWGDGSFGREVRRMDRPSSWVPVAESDGERVAILHYHAGHAARQALGDHATTPA